MTLPDVVPRPFLQLLEALRFWFPFAKNGPMDILGTHQSGTANNHPIAVVIPHQSRSRADPQSLSNLGRNRDLPL
jgi:hypothetical protein